MTAVTIATMPASKNAMTTTEVKAKAKAKAKAKNAARGTTVTVMASANQSAQQTPGAQTIAKGS